MSLAIARGRRDVFTAANMIESRFACEYSGQRRASSYGASPDSKDADSLHRAPRPRAIALMLMLMHGESTCIPRQL